jgi:gluconolactonase
MEMGVEGVYRIDEARVGTSGPGTASPGTASPGTASRVTRILGQPAVERPNGVAVTQDGRRLYVVDSCPTPGGNRKVWAFDLDEEGAPGNQRLVYDFAPGRGGDGMRLDVEGNLYVAAGVAVPRGPHETAAVPPGVYVITPQGKLLGRIAVPEDVITNLAFGGRDGRTLYVTAGKTVYTTRVATPGQVAWPRWA